MSPQKFTTQTALTTIRIACIKGVKGSKFNLCAGNVVPLSCSMMRWMSAPCAVVLLCGALATTVGDWSSSCGRRWRSCVCNDQLIP